MFENDSWVVQNGGMDEAGEIQRSLRYVTNRGWWTPSLLVLAWVAVLAHSRRPAWWSIVDVALFVIVLSVLYLVTHPTLTFSPSTIAQRRGPFRVSIDLANLASVRVNTMTRGISVVDPQTGQRPQINFFYPRRQDVGAATLPRGVYLRDTRGHRLALNFLRTDVTGWGACLVRALKAQPEVELGPQVMATLERVVR